MSDSALAEDPIALSGDLLRSVRAGESPDFDALAGLDPDALDAALPTDAERLPFWLNVYNAVAIDTLRQHPGWYENRRTFFARELVTVAGQSLSLDDIEHGLLRRSQWKLGLGYIPNPFAGAFETRFRVDEVDPRIHFALNCGARSCPAIAVYTRDIDPELDRAAEGYLQSEVEYDGTTARVPRLLLWFRGDFGGGSGIRAMLRRYGLIPEDATPRIRYLPYDWTLKLDAFK
ncbi:DUF547 domain-containing protein [Natronomonas sp. EA1]|uniref:DUF547 domain-containing protein n=1 Tax=Natronomonas sp. EA1 TaxID=3421655 RepID=UPI003EBBA271